MNSEKEIRDKVKGALELIGEQYGSDLGIDKNYIDNVLERADKGKIERIPDDGVYSVYRADYCLFTQIFMPPEGQRKMLIGDYTATTKGDVYIIGRSGLDETYFRIDGNNVKKRTCNKNNAPLYISRVQVAVVPEENELEVINLGKNPIEIKKLF
ncbi:MAG: hypothetical protein J7K26_01930 [Candidatus Aenigmarchaeota archaeon]|nr:hypothetical protein [Candidatus Aenigmarchaeota archaeon]